MIKLYPDLATPARISDQTGAALNDLIGLLCRTGDILKELTVSRSSLLWFTNNLRLDDNSVFNAVSEDAKLQCIYIHDPRIELFFHLGEKHLSTHRTQFLQQTISTLDQQLSTLGQCLNRIDGDYLESLTRLVQQHSIDKIVTSRHTGSYEQQALKAIAKRFPHLQIVVEETATIFQESQLPFALSDLDNSFTPFRKRVEGLVIDQPVTAPTSLPPPILQSSIIKPVELTASVHGGEVAALRHLETYFNSTAPLTYKETRNALDDWQSSTKLSPWLAVGALSCRRVIARLSEYESQNGANESTYWIKFELLWREYFQWYALHWGDRLYAFKGPHNRNPLTSYYAERFRAWREGHTHYPIINAAMKQLKATGYISNRARQLVASCLVHELAIDWRYGAEYFEQQLLDFDIASNWGNWQYLAGVGADPRGHRQFNLEKQTEIHDPQHRFIKSWDGHKDCQTTALFDYYGDPLWPVNK